jgi:hypothetical protein
MASIKGESSTRHRAPAPHCGGHAAQQPRRNEIEMRNSKPEENEIKSNQSVSKCERALVNP